MQRQRGRVLDRVVLGDRTPQTYLDFASDYYEVLIDTAAIDQVWALQPLDDVIVAAPNPDITLGDVQRDAGEIGYPLVLPPHFGGG